MQKNKLIGLFSMEILIFLNEISITRLLHLLQWRSHGGPTKTGSHPGAGAVITKTGSLRGRPIF